MISWKNWYAILIVFVCLMFTINMIVTPNSQASSDSEPSELDTMVNSLSPALGAVDTPQDLQETTTATITTVNIMPAIKTLLLK